MGFCRYYLKRYENNEAFFYKVIIILTTIAMCIPIFARYNNNYVVGGCGKDAVFAMMGRFIFPLIEIVCVLLYMKLALKDTNQNIIIRYGSMKRIWNYQCLGAMLFSLENILLIYIGTITFGTIFFGSYDKWHMEGSMFYNAAMKMKMPLELPVSSIQMFALIIITKTVILSITIDVALVAYYLLNSIRMSILSAIVLCGFDWLNLSGVCGLLDVTFRYLYDSSKCVLRIIIGVIIIWVMYLAGLIILSQKDVYNRKL